MQFVIPSRPRSIGAFTVGRVLPYPKRRAIGPFTFLDHMGPAAFAADADTDVLPHPHIGLATVTYLFEGGVVHRDSLGTVQHVGPGDLGWMTAGRGIVHSERRPPGAGARRLHGLQLWAALPAANEEDPPSWQFTPAAALPVARFDGAEAVLVAGAAWGLEAPVRVLSPLVFAVATLRPDERLPVPEGFDERGVYVAQGSVSVGGHELGAGQLGVLDAGPVTLRGRSLARVAILGGTSLGPRLLDWNFVSTRADRLARARADWRERRFPPIPGDDDAYVPLPE